MNHRSAGGTSLPRTSGMKTPAVRGRMVIGVVLILAITLLSAGIVIGTVYDRQSRTAASALLTSRMQLARQLAGQGVSARQLVNRVDAQGVTATLTLTTGERLGSPPDSGPRREAVLAGSGPIRGARLVLTIDASLLDQSRTALTRTLLLTGLAALLLGALLTVLLTSTVLAPLRRTAGIARRIAAGERGLRLEPTSPGSELGQTAIALDSMLDALEGAERDAVWTRIRGEQFLADVAHELRTPMTGVRLAAETLLHQDLRPDDRDQLLAQIVGEVQRSGNLLDQLLALARSAEAVTDHRAALSLMTSAAAEIDVLSRIHPQLHIVLRTDPAFDPTVGPANAGTVVMAEPTALRSMVRNLLDNAVQAAAASPRRTEQPWVRCRCQVSGGFVTLEVADSGSGVAPGERELIFERMHRGDGDRSRSAPTGSGLGLSMARRFARLHGGDVVLATSRPGDLPPGNGAVFHLVLPVAQEFAHQRAVLGRDGVVDPMADVVGHQPTVGDRRGDHL